MLNARDLVATLNHQGIEYVVIGGFAVAAHGYVRATKDLNIVPAADARNLRRLAAVLGSLDAKLFGVDDFDSAEFPFDPLDPLQLAQRVNFLLMTRFGRLDMMQRVPGIPVDHAYERLRPAAIQTKLEGDSHLGLLARGSDHDEARCWASAGSSRLARVGCR